MQMLEKDSIFYIHFKKQTLYEGELRVYTHTSFQFIHTIPGGIIEEQHHSRKGA